MTRHTGLGAIQVDGDIQGVQSRWHGQRREQLTGLSALGIPVRTNGSKKRGYSNKERDSTGTPARNFD